MAISFKESSGAIPGALLISLARNEARYLQACQENGICTKRLTSEYLSDLRQILAVSEFVSDVFCKYPLLPIEAYESGLPPLTKNQLQEHLLSDLSDVHHLEEYSKQLRVLRAQQSSLIIWRLLLNKTDMSAHLAELSLLADSLVKHVGQRVQMFLTDTVGRACTESGENCQFVIIALGKLGGQELNFSSDIDLIFAYTDSGSVLDSKTPITIEQYFTRFAQLVIAILSDRTMDGFVYRVDMRLRPYGDSGALVLSLNQLEHYYQYQGRDWERYALIKSRLIFGNVKAHYRLKSIIGPFVYRRYLDYSAFEALREMKVKVALDVKKNNRKDDIKLGVGGIRQIEFIMQAFQLIQGGKIIAIQKHNLLKAIAELHEHQIIDSKKHDALKEAYIFLRALEHFIQMIRDEQTHQLPTTTLDQARVAYAMQQKDWKYLVNQLQDHLNNVSYYFEALSALPSIVQHASNQKSHVAHGLWVAQCKEEAPDIGFSKSFYEQLYQFKNSTLIRQLKAKAKSRLDKVMPVVIDVVIHSKDPEKLLSRTLQFLRAIVRRSAYLVFLIEKEGALLYLLKIFEKSEWIHAQLCQYPVLLDDMLAPLSVHQIHSKASWAQQLSLKLKGLENDDLEQQMEKLRQFKSAGFLNIALHDLLDKQKINISKAITSLVEAILEQTYAFCLQFLIAQYKINVSVERLIDDFPFAIIAYGKLGAKEMTYFSDLDLVFIFDDDVELLKHIDLDKEIFIRLAQRMIHMLSTPTLSGKLFEIDVRLRPGGSAGMLASSFDGYKKYLNHQAWIWEHQALVNARFISGSPSLCAKFQIVRHDTLSYPRNEKKLKKTISEMRNKLLAHQGNTSDWNIKTVPGGMVDIEFIAQFGILYYAYQQPDLTKAYGTMQILDKLKKERFLSEYQVEILRNAYQYYQFLQNNRLLQCQDKFSTQTLITYQTQVDKIWQYLFTPSETR